MNGWERLGFVVATLIAAPTAAITFDMQRTITAHVPNGPEISALNGQQAINMAYQMALKKGDSDIRDCEKTRVKVYAPVGSYDNDWDLSCERTPMARLGKAIQYGIIPYLVIWAIGLTIGWIRAGFRPRTA